MSQAAIVGNMSYLATLPSCVLYIRPYGTPSGGTTFKDWETAHTAKTVTPTSAVNSTASLRFSPASIYFNGSAYLTTSGGGTLGFPANTALAVSFWFNATSFASQPCFFCTVGSSAFYLYFSTSTILKVGIAGVETSITVPTLSTGAWYHCYLTRTAAGAFSFYLNGVAATLSLTNTAIINVSGLGFLLGEYQGDSLKLTGYMDEFAFFNGNYGAVPAVSAVYSATYPYPRRLIV
jgi:hypothetical protein